MEIPGLGRFVADDVEGWFYSEPVPVPMLGGHLCRIMLDGYADDPAKEDFHAAARHFLSSLPRVLEVAAPHVYRYYQRCNADLEPADDGYLALDRPADVWPHVQFGSDAIIQRRAYGDQRVYVSLECECAWEPEHGLQIVFEGGHRVNKVGPYDGHLTNADAYGDESLETVIYHG